MESDPAVYSLRGNLGPIAPRYYAILHVALFDAVNAVEREYTPFRVQFTIVLEDPRKPRPHKPRTILSARCFPVPRDR